MEKTGLGEYLKPGSRYLDIGCGKGHLLALMQSEGVKTFGLDLFDIPTRSVNQKIGKVFSIATDEQLPFAAASFDGVSLMFVLHHTSEENQKEALREALRISKGYIFIAEDISTEETKSTVERVDRRLNPLERLEGRHSHHYRSDTQWKKMFAELGLSVEKEVKFRMNIKDPVEHVFFALRK